MKKAKRSSRGFSSAIYQAAVEPLEQRRLLSVEGVVFLDKFDTGVPSPSFTPLPGRTVYADLNSNGVLDSGEPSTITDGSGSYTLQISAPAAILTVSPAGWVSTTAPVIAQPNSTAVNIGEFALMTVSGTIYADTNADGTQEPSEPGLPGVTVYEDVNFNNKYDAGEPTATTASDGSYAITGVVPTTKFVPDVHDLPVAGYLAESNGTAFSEQSGSNTHFSTGYTKQSYVSGAVFVNLGNNLTGQLPGVTVYADLNNDGILDAGDVSTVASNYGIYQFGGLPQGPVTMRVVVPTGYTSSGGTGSVPITVGALNASSAYFTLIQTASLTGTIGGVVFADGNANGFQDSSDSGIVGATVYLDLNTDGILDAGDTTTTTGANGAYSFTGIQPGQYLVGAVAGTGHYLSTPSEASVPVFSGTTSNATFGVAKVRSPGTLYVDLNAPGPTHDGTSWSTAFTKLQQALSIAVSGDQIDVAHGTYVPGNLETSTFTLKSGVTLSGGYAGSGAANPNARDVVANATVLSGDIGVAGDNSDNITHILTASFLSGITIDGFTITAGNANTGNPFSSSMGINANFGGGIYLNTSSITIRNCVLSNNAADRGGAIYGAESSITITDSTLKNNTAFTEGGALALEESPDSLTLTHCTFTGNSVTGTNNSSGFGGAVDIEAEASSDVVNISGCTFTGNTGQYCAGLSVEGTMTLTVDSCTFVSNAASSQGGGLELINMYESTTAPKVTNCTFTGNSSLGQGGGLYADGANALVSGCTFTNNTAATSGGGIYDLRSNLSVISSKFFANGAVDGAGMENEGYATNAYFPSVANSVFVGNVATRDGDAIDDFECLPSITDCTITANGNLSSTATIYSYLSSSVAAANDIIWGNQGSKAIYNADAVDTVTYSDLPGVSGLGNFSADPAFLRAPSAGSDGTWGTSDDDYGDLHLGISSACIDAGNNAAVPAGVTTDLAGNSRFIDVPAVADTGSGSVPIVDIGAYEAKVLQASAGGPYSVGEGSSITLDGSGSTAGGGVLKYEWDFNYNGTTFTVDATAMKPTFSAVGIDGPTQRVIGLRVTDLANQVSSVSTTTLTISNVAPTAVFSGSSATLGGTGTVSFTSPTDPSAADIAAGFKYSYDFNNDGTFDLIDSAIPTATVPAQYLTAVGPHTIKGRIEDKDGDFTDYTANVQVNSGNPVSGGSISGTVFNDANGNGKLDSNELGLANITLYNDANNNGKQDTSELTTAITDASGHYSFLGLPAGNYKIRQVLPAGSTQTTPSNGYGWTVTLKANQVVTGDNFGEQTVTPPPPPPTGGSISGTVFNDLNGNGALNTGELGIVGIVIYNDANNNGKMDSGEANTLTDSSGNYTLSNLSAGNYKIRETVPAGWKQTSPANGFGWTLTLTKNQTLTAKSFGEQSVVAPPPPPPTTGGSISGTVFNDANGNSKKDASELGLSAWTIFIDSNNDGILDNGELSTSTKSDGTYSFTNLAAGNYLVRAVRPAGWSQTTPANGFGQHLTLAKNQNLMGVQFGEKSIA